MVLRRDVVGMLQIRSLLIQRTKTGLQAGSIQSMVARLTLLALDQEPGFFQGSGVMAEQRQRDLHGIGNIFAGTLLSIGQEFHDLQPGGVAQSFEDFGTVGQIKLAHRAMLLPLNRTGKLNA